MRVRKVAGVKQGIRLNMLLLWALGLFNLPLKPVQSSQASYRKKCKQNVARIDVISDCKTGCENSRILVGIKIRVQVQL